MWTERHKLHNKAEEIQEDPWGDIVETSPKRIISMKAPYDEDDDKLDDNIDNS